MKTPQNKAKELINRLNTELCYSIERSKHAAQMAVDIIISEVVNTSDLQFEYWHQVQNELKNY